MCFSHSISFCADADFGCLSRLARLTTKNILFDQPLQSPSLRNFSANCHDGDISDVPLRFGLLPQLQTLHITCRRSIYSCSSRPGPEGPKDSFLPPYHESHSQSRWQSWFALLKRYLTYTPWGLWSVFAFYTTCKSTLPQHCCLNLVQNALGEEELDGQWFLASHQNVA